MSTGIRAKSAAELIEEYEKHPDRNLAQRAYEAVKGIIFKEGEVYLSSPENTHNFLIIMANAEEGKMLALFVDILPNDEYVTRWSCDAEDCQNVVASFMLAYPDAIFSVESGYPIYLLAGPNWRKMCSLKALQEAVQLGFREFGFGVKSDKDKNK